MFTARYWLGLKEWFRLSLIIKNAPPWLRVSFAGLSPRMPGFNPRWFRVNFVVFKLALGQPFLQESWCSPVNIVPPILPTHLHLPATLTRRTKRRSLVTFRESLSFRNWAALDTEVLLTFFHLQRLNTQLAALNMECVLRGAVTLLATFLTSSKLTKITKFRSLLLLLLLLFK